MIVPKVLNKNILIRKVDREPTKKTFLILDHSNSEQKEFMVDAIGEEVANINIGDRVVVPPYGGTSILHNDISYLVIDSTSVLAILPKN